MRPSGKLELTWTNKHLRLLADEVGGYTWVEPSAAELKRLTRQIEALGFEVLVHEKAAA